MNQDFENILNDPMARNHGHLSPRCGMRLSFRNNRESNMADKTRAFLVDYAQLDNVSRPAENPREGSCTRWRK